MICGQKSKTRVAMISHLKRVHKEHIKQGLPAVHKVKKTYMPWYIIFGIITTLVIAIFINTLISMPHINAFLLYTASVAFYVLICVLALGYALENDNQVLKSFMMGTLGIVPGLIVETLFNESRGKSKDHFLIALFLSWLSTVAIVFMIFAVLAFSIA
jgi:hypothetical protein